MIITLNEYTLALLCGGVSCLTYVVIHLNDIDENKLTKNNDDKKSATFANDITPSTSELSSRRQSQLAARFRSQRAESVKNDHVVFADEFNEQDQKFAPHIDHMEEESEVPRFCFYFCKKVFPTPALLRTNSNCTYFCQKLRSTYLVMQLATL